MSIVNNRCEVAKLKTMIVHRPGEELNNLVPHFLERQLFDDTPWLKVAQEEHDAYVKLLRSLGVNVLYIRDLAAETAELDCELRRDFMMRFLNEANISTQTKYDMVKEYLSSLSAKEMVDTMISGLNENKLGYKGNHLEDYIPEHYPFVLDPMPNMYFTRDPFSFVGKGVIISRLFTDMRNRENLIGDFVLKNHPMFKGLPVYYERDARYCVEGGDVMVLAPDVLAIGISQRTNVNAVEKIAERLLFDEDSGFKKLLAIDIPKTRSYMHLDTVFTMVDKDKFAVHPNVVGQFRIFVLENDGGKLKITEEKQCVKDVLKKHLNVDRVTLIECGGRNYIDSEREQWNDGSNTLAVAPGEIIVYARNEITNRLLVDNGIKVHEIPCSELSRGRGGPHCMSQAAVRE